MEFHTIALLTMFICMILSRIIITKATKTLDQEKKATLVDMSSGKGLISLIVWLVIIMFFIIAMKFEWLSLGITFGILIILSIGLPAMLIYSQYQRLRKNEFPNSFIKSYILSTLISFLGLIILVIALSIPIFKNPMHHRLEHHKIHPTAHLKKPAINDGI